MALLEAHEFIIKANRERYDKLVNIIVNNVQEDDEKVSNLEAILRLSEKTAKNEQIVKNAKEAAQSVEEPNNNEDIQETKFDDIMQKYNDMKKEFCQGKTLERLVNEDDQVTRIRDLIKELGSNEAEEHDEDIKATQELTSLIDPISKKMMEDPVRHIPCGHVYDKASVLAVMKQNKRKGFRCPYIGCQYRQPIQRSNLVEAKDYKQQIENRKQSGNYN